MHAPFIPPPAFLAFPPQQLLRANGFGKKHHRPTIESIFERSNSVISHELDLIAASYADKTN